MLVIFLCLSFVNYQWVWEVSGMFPGQIYLDKIKEDWLLFYVFLLFPTDCHSKKRLLLKVAFLYLFSCFSLASILSNFAQVVQCTKPLGLFFFKCFSFLLHFLTCLYPRAGKSNMMSLQLEIGTKSCHSTNSVENR